MAEQTRTIRIRMLTSQAGYTPVPVFDESGKVIGEEAGPMFTREPKEEYDVPEPEAKRLIEKGYATLATPKSDGSKKVA